MDNISGKDCEQRAEMESRMGLYKWIDETVDLSAVCSAVGMSSSCASDFKIMTQDMPVFWELSVR